MSFDYKQFNIAQCLAFIGLMMLGMNIGTYLGGLLGLLGYAVTCLSFVIVFILTGYAIGMNMTLPGLVFCVLFGCFSVWIGAWLEELFGLASVFVSLISGFLLYWLLQHFTNIKAIKRK